MSSKILYMIHYCDHTDWDEGQAQMSGQARGVFSLLGVPQRLACFVLASPHNFLSIIQL